MLVSDPMELIIHPDLWAELKRANSRMQKTGWLTELKKLHARPAASSVGDACGKVSFAMLKSLVEQKGGTRRSVREWKDMEDKLETDKYGNVYLCAPPPPLLALSQPSIHECLCHN